MRFLFPNLKRKKSILSSRSKYSSKSITTGSVSRSSTNNSPSNVCNTIRNRNAFMHYLSAYRKDKQNDESYQNRPVWNLVIEAAELWNNMPLNEKFTYIESARNTAYVYSSRDRRFNRIMDHLRKAMTNEYRIDVIELAKAAKIMKLWKRRVLSDILCA